MQPYGSHGMIYSWIQRIAFPSHMEMAGKLWKIENYQVGPRGRLPICPDTCFVHGGTFPSNTLPNHTAPQGAGKDYYDTLKGDSSEGLREPFEPSNPEVPPFTQQSGQLFNAHLSDILSGDVRWYTDMNKKKHMCFVAANRNFYYYRIDDKSKIPVLKFKFNIPDELLVRYPLNKPKPTPVGYEGPPLFERDWLKQRSFRIDPKRSVIANDNFYVLVSFCDWTIKPGKAITITDAERPLVTYAADDATGRITAYDPHEKRWSDPAISPATYSVTIDDSYSILAYRHILFGVNLKTYEVLEPIMVFQEHTSGTMPMVVQPMRPQQGIYWKGHLASYGAPTHKGEWGNAYNDACYGVLNPDGSGQLVTNGWSSLDIPPEVPNKTTAPALPVWCEKSADWPYTLLANPECVTNGHAYWWGHFHITEPHLGVRLRGLTYLFWDGDPPAENKFSYAIKPEKDYNRTDWIDSMHKAQPPPDEPETVAPYCYPMQTRLTSPGGGWEYLLFAASWTSCYYDGAIHQMGLYGPVGITYCPWSPDSLPPDYAWRAGNGRLRKYIPIPYETMRIVKSEELIVPDVFENCLSTDSTFSDLAVFEVVENKVTEQRIAFIRWGAITSPFTDIVTTKDTNTGDPTESGYREKETSMNKNNNPCVYRKVRQASKPVLHVVSHKTNQSISIPVPSNALIAGEWGGTGGNYKWNENQVCRDLVMHNEVRPTSIWTPRANDCSHGDSKCVGKEGGKFPNPLMSPDSHVQGNKAYAQYNINTITATGTGATGRHQTFVIPLKFGTENYGAAFFVSSLGMLDGDVKYSSWHEGVGDAAWCDKIYEGMQVNKMVTNWAIISVQGTPLSYTTAENKMLPGQFANEWLCRWAAYIELEKKEYIIVGMQSLDYRDKDNIFKKAKVYAIDVAMRTMKKIWPSASSDVECILGTGAVVIPADAQERDARVIFSYYSGQSNDYGLVSCYMNAISTRNEKTGPYDQLMIEPLKISPGIQYLYGLKSGNKLDIIDAVDLKVKKTIPLTANSISTGSELILTGRKDTIGEKVKTAVGNASGSFSIAAVPTWPEKPPAGEILAFTQTGNTGGGTTGNGTGGGSGGSGSGSGGVTGGGGSVMGGTGGGSTGGSPVFIIDSNGNVTNSTGGIEAEHVGGSPGIFIPASAPDQADKFRKNDGVIPGTPAENMLYAQDKL